MCEGVAFLVKDGERYKVMENVVSLHLRDEKAILVDEFGRDKVIEGVKEVRVNMVAHEITLYP